MLLLKPTEPNVSIYIIHWVVRVYDISLMTMFCRQFQTAFVVEMPEVLHHVLSPIRRTKFLLHGQDGWIGEDVVGIIATAL